MKNTTPTPPAGPRRLILIQSGKYDYAELDLTQSLQLVGVNGLGKTALIGTLQYLYIDDQKAMRFGQHSTDESRRFYFKTPSSYILYECETTMGLFTLGARSSGAATGYELQRFTYKGGYERADFITEDNHPRPWDDVRQKLALKELNNNISGEELRRLLGAVDSDTRTSWEIVPLADATDYNRFRQTFHRLLHLQDIKQKDLKQLLADCARLTSSEREIDLAKDFQKELTKIERDRNEIKRLKNAKTQVEELRSLADEELAARTIAHAIATETQRRYAEYVKEYTNIVDSYLAVKDKADTTIFQLEENGRRLLKKFEFASESAVFPKQTLARIEQNEKRFASFALEIEEQGRNLLSDEVIGLESQLKDVPGETLETLAGQLKRKQEELEQKKKAEARLSELFITWLRENIDADDLSRLGALFNRRILESILGEEVTIRSEKELLERIKTIAGNCNINGYADDTINIKFHRSSLSTVESIGNVQILREEIRALERESKRLEKNIETLQNTKAIREQLNKRKNELRAKDEEISNYKGHLKDLERKSNCERELKELEKEKAETQENIKVNEEAKRKASAEKDAAIRKFESLQKADEKIRAEALDLPLADGEKTEDSPLAADFIKSLPNNDPETLLDVIQKARSRCTEARILLRQINDKMQVLDRDFGLSSFYDASLPNEKKLQQLENEIASIPSRTEDIENRWRGILTESRRSFHTILKSLEEIQKQIQKLNRELAKMEFSSLSEVRLEISPERNAVSEYERYSKDANQPSLFDAIEDATRRLEQFNQLLQRRPRLVLNDLFSLRCEVRRKDGIKNHYDDLDQIESTGTTIVLKVILNLLVLRDLLIPGKARIPYYLDEVHALDRQNLANIIHLSERLGFVGIYAAPTDAAGPRRFVYLVPDAKGRLVVTPNHQKDIVRVPGESSLPTDAPDSNLPALDAAPDASTSHE